jgi:hypothetical protein
MKMPIVVALMNDLLRAEVIDRNRFLGLSRRSPGRGEQTPPSEDGDGPAARRVRRAG